MFYLKVVARHACSRWRKIPHDSPVYSVNLPTPKTKTVVKFTPPLHVTFQIPGISQGGKHLDFSKYLEEDESPWDQIQSPLCLPLHSYHTPVGRG